METNRCTTIRRDRGLSAAHGGALFGAGVPTSTVKRINGVAPMSAFAVPAYVTDQESIPPRGRPA